MMFTKFRKVPNCIIEKARDLKYKKKNRIWKANGEKLESKSQKVSQHELIELFEWAQRSRNLYLHCYEGPRENIFYFLQSSEFWIICEIVSEENNFRISELKVVLDGREILKNRFLRTSNEWKRRASKCKKADA